LALSEPFAALLPADVSAGFRLPLGFWPLQRHPSGEPHVKRAVTPTSGSARRFSQPLSGFLANPSFAALFRAATVPGVLPSERSPRRDRLPLPGQLGFPAVIHRRAATHAPAPCHRWFHRRPRRSALAWIPQRLWTPFSRAEARFLVALGAEPRNRPVPPASPTSKRPSLFESVHRCSGSPH